MKLIAVAGLAIAIGASAAERTPVVLELFTSEGCSSCPPADQLLADFDRKQPVDGVDLIVLSEHVDYWNRLGWTDPYSSELFSARQQKYAGMLHPDDVYTPQVVVDGQQQLVGSRAAAVSAAVQKAGRQTKIPISLSAQRVDGKIEVQVQWTGAEKLHQRVAVYLALAQNEAESQVRAGENSGHMLKHVAVVRKITAVGTLEAGKPFAKAASLAAPPEWGAVRVVAFLQEQGSGRIVGAAQRKL